MPRKANYVSRPGETRTPERISKAVREKCEKLNDEAIAGPLRRARKYLTGFSLPLHRLLLEAKKQGDLTSFSKPERLDRLPKPIAVVDAAYNEIIYPRLEEAVRQAVADKTLTGEEGQMIYQHLPDHQRGMRIQQTLEACIQLFGQESPSDPVQAAIWNACNEAHKVILKELARLEIVKTCAYCGKTFFPASPRKRFCSQDYEGRNCSANYRSRKSYQKNRKKSGSK